MLILRCILRMRINKTTWVECLLICNMCVIQSSSSSWHEVLDNLTKTTSMLQSNFCEWDDNKVTSWSGSSWRVLDRKQILVSCKGMCESWESRTTPTLTWETTCKFVCLDVPYILLMLMRIENEFEVYSYSTWRTWHPPETFSLQTCSSFHSILPEKRRLEGITSCFDDRLCIT